MPYISGFELAKLIRAQESAGEHQRLIMLSAYLYDEVKTQSEASGSDAFAIKPVSEATFKDLLHT